MGDNGIREKVENIFDTIEEKARDAAKLVADKTLEIADENKDGKINLIDFLIKALKTKPIKVERAEYLRKSFKKYYDESTIEKAIETTPAKANISKEIVERIAQNAIALEKTVVTVSSIGLGYTPGGLGIDAATTVADLAQYYGHILVVMQKLMYLYGYPELELESENGNIDDETMNLIIMGVGTMAGVKEAAKFINIIAEKLAINVPKQILKKGFSTKVAFKVVKKVLNYVGIKLTKDVATKGIANAIKFVGGVAMGGMTFAAFSSSCDNFHKAIKDTPLSDSNYIANANAIDVDFKIIEDELEKEFADLKDEDIEENE